MNIDRGKKALASAGTTKSGVPVRGDTKKTENFEVKQLLSGIAQSDRASASAKVNAMRTLAEMQGFIGKHQAAPERQGAPLSLLSRAELVSELERLRTLMGLGLVS